MMNFIVMTLSFVVANLLLWGIAIALVMNKRVMKWYANKVMELTFSIMEPTVATSSEDEES